MKPALLFAFLPGLIFLAACSASTKTPPLTAGERQTIEAYLVREIGVSSLGGEVFCPFEVLAQDAGRTRLYVWTMCMEYVVIDRKLMKGTGSSLPVSLTLEGRGESLEVTGSRTPPEGWSADSLEEIFPPGVIRRFCLQDPDCHNDRAARLETGAEQAARNFYSLNP
jgi:hypothetical protein